MRNAFVCVRKKKETYGHRQSAPTTCLSFNVFSAHPVTFPLFFPGLTTKENKSLKSVERGSREEELGEHKTFHVLASVRCTVGTQGCLLVPRAQIRYLLTTCPDSSLLSGFWLGHQHHLSDSSREAEGHCHP